MKLFAGCNKSFSQEMVNFTVYLAYPERCRDHRSPGMRSGVLRGIGALDTVRRRGVCSSFTGVNFHVKRIRNEEEGGVGMSVR